MVSLWPIPHGKPTLFAFRVDTDYCTEEQVDALAAVCQDHRISATWFIETASAKKYLKHFAALKDQELGLHCYRHRVFRDFVKNERDIYQSLRLLSREKIRVRGYAAPFGLWNSALAKAVEHHGFTYSSEFTLDYDNLPFYPFLGDRFSTVLQMPIHPITTGHLRNARHSDQDMKDYWRHRIEDHEKFRLPLIVYDHPSQADTEVVNWLFKEIREREIPTLSLLEYAQWWKKRASLSWTVELEDNTLRITSTVRDSSIWLAIRKSPTELSTFELNDSVDLKELNWENVNPDSPRRTPMALLRTVNRKMIMNDILNRYWRIRSGKWADEERG